MRFNRRWRWLWLFAAWLLFGAAAAAAETITHRASPEAATAVSIDELPADARETLARIRSGGPFPFERDGVVFNNYERLLPPRPRGFYHEYTVTAPGSTRRGVRRLVVGCERATGRSAHRSDGPQVFRGCNGLPELYYTEDHYRSFRRVVP